MTSLTITIVGLLFDLVGVLILGIDLLRVQKALRKEAAQRQEAMSKIFSEYVEPSRWSEDIRENAKLHRVYVGEYGHSEGLLENVARLAEGLKETASIIDIMVEGIGDVIKLEIEKTKIDFETSKKSLGFTYFGLILIILGFGLQVIAAVRSVI